MRCDERVESGYLGLLDCWSSSWQFLTILVDWCCFSHPLWHPAQPWQGLRSQGPSPLPQGILVPATVCDVLWGYKCTLNSIICFKIKGPKEICLVPWSLSAATCSLFGLKDVHSEPSGRIYLAGMLLENSGTRTQLMLVNFKCGANASVGSKAE